MDIQEDRVISATNANEVPTFYNIPCETKPAQKRIEDGPTVADELNAQLALLNVRSDRSEAIRRLTKKKPPGTQHIYKLQCVCPPYHPCYAPCQHTGQIIIDRDVLSRKEHLCFLAAPKKDISAPRKKPHCYQKKIAVPTCTARLERLAEPHPLRVQDTMKYFEQYLRPRNLKALKFQMEPKPAVEAMNLDKALEYIEEEQRLRRAARHMQRRRCRSLKKRILQRQRKQMRKIVCVLFEEMKDFLLNDQFIIDEHSPLCAVILERIKDFTDQEFYTTSNLREYQRILANNLTVWINKFISNLNIYLAPQQIAPQRLVMHGEDPERFVPVTDYISISEPNEEAVAEEGDDDLFDYGVYDEDFMDIMDPPDASDETLTNV